MSSPFARSSIVRTLSQLSPAISLHLLLSSSLSGTSIPWNSPPRHFMAAAEITPSGAPPFPIIMSTPESSKHVAMAAATSPSPNSLILAPTALALLIKSACLSLSCIITVTSVISLFSAFATLYRFSSIGAVMSMCPAA
ncbi:hypothetical protein SDC9_109408 [bioreactor metagenome]|uniref:Uncharacterized protein n=1 Tax=bioreactor metagenome TaxID=1076179 RepID=A0A645BAQ3_9ZZZZ